MGDVQSQVAAVHELLERGTRFSTVGLKPTSVREDQMLGP